MPDEILYEVEKDNEIIKVKKCSRCLKYKRVEYFSKSNRTYQSNVYLSQCRKCRAKKQKEIKTNLLRVEGLRKGV